MLQSLGASSSSPTIPATFLFDLLHHSYLEYLTLNLLIFELIFILTLNILQLLLQIFSFAKSPYLMELFLWHRNTHTHTQVNHCHILSLCHVYYHHVPYLQWVMTGVHIPWNVQYGVWSNGILYRRSTQFTSCFTRRRGESMQWGILLSVLNCDMLVPTGQQTRPVEWGASVGVLQYR